MSLSEAEIYQLLKVKSILGQILRAHGIGKDIPASVKRCAKELTTYEAEKITDVRDDVPETTDSQADGFSEQ